MTGLKAGERYIYYESAAPEGYLVNRTKYTLTVSDTGTVSGLKDIVNQPQDAPSSTPSPTPSTSPAATPKPSVAPTAKPTGMPEVNVTKPIPQTGVENGMFWRGFGALLLLTAAGYIGMRIHRSRKQRNGSAGSFI